MREKGYFIIYHVESVSNIFSDILAYSALHVLHF